MLELYWSLLHIVSLLAALKRQVEEHYSYAYTWVWPCVLRLLKVTPQRCVDPKGGTVMEDIIDYSSSCFCKQSTWWAFSSPATKAQAAPREKFYLKLKMPCNHFTEHSFRGNKLKNGSGNECYCSTPMAYPSFRNAHFSYENRMGTKIATPEILLDTQEFSSIRLPTQGVMYPKRSCRQRMGVHYTIMRICRSCFGTGPSELFASPKR